MRDNPLRLYSEAQLAQLPPPEWLIEGLVPKHAMVTIYGPPGAGKSFLALDFAMCISTASQFFGRHVEPGPVVYLAQEAISGIPKRLAAWRHSRGCAVPSSLFVSGEFQSLMTVESIESLTSALQEELPVDMNPAMVVFDTLGMSCIGADENDAAHMNRVMKNAKILTDGLDPCTVVFIHHTTKNRGTERGSTAIRGACDTMISVTQTKTGKVRVAVSKQRDWETPKPLFFDLEKVSDSAVLVSDDAEETLQDVVPRSIDPVEVQILSRIAQQPEGITFVQIQESMPDCIMQKIARMIASLHKRGEIVMTDDKPRLYKLAP